MSSNNLLKKRESKVKVKQDFIKINDSEKDFNNNYISDSTKKLKQNYSFNKFSQTPLKRQQSTIITGIIKAKESTDFINKVNSKDLWNGPCHVQLEINLW